MKFFICTLLMVAVVTASRDKRGIFGEPGGLLSSSHALHSAPLLSSHSFHSGPLLSSHSLHTAPLLSSHSLHAAPLLARPAPAIIHAAPIYSSHAHSAPLLSAAAAPPSIIIRAPIVHHARYVAAPRPASGWW